MRFLDLAVVVLEQVRARPVEHARGAAGERSRMLAGEPLPRGFDTDDPDLRLALLKPETYMNVSGKSIAAASRFFKAEPDALLVVHDDVDLEPGRLQARSGGGLAGHNGLRSIAGSLGTQDFLRLRIGVGRPGRGDRRPVADYVLSAFEPELDVDALIARAADAVETIALEGVEAAQQRFN